MFRTIGVTFCLTVACSLVATSQTTNEEHKLTQRELFYSPPPASAGPAQDAGDPHSKRTPAPAPGKLRLNPQSSRPWEVRCGVLELRPDGRFQGTDVYRTVFHSGDQLRIRVEANQETFLSILERGSTGKWKTLFPSPRINNGQERVPGFQATEIPPPPGRGFVFDDHAGQEDVYLVVSRTYIDTRPLIAELNKHHVDEPTKNRIETAVVNPNDLLREIAEDTTSMGSRDLVFEQAEEDTADGLREIAFYARHAASSPDSRPSVVHFSLKHAEGRIR